MHKKLRHFTLTLLFLCLGGLGAFAQTYPVTISTQLTQPSPIYLSNYANTASINSPIKVQLTLNDLTIMNRQVRLKCYFQGAVSFVTNDFVAGALPIYLEGGVPTLLTNVELGPYFEFQNLQGINPNQYAQPLPEGIYTLSFEIYDFATNKKLSKKSSVTTVIFQNEPPLLNLPANKAGITEQNIQNVIFSWTPRSINVSNVEYEFSLVEIWNTNTPIQNAFAYSPPLYTTTTRNTTVHYSIAEPQLISGKTYAWRVKAKALVGAEEIGVFKNNGYSEIFSFKYLTLCNAPIAITTTDVSQEQAKITWSGAVDNYDYQVNYREKNADSKWYQLVTPREYITISNLKPKTTYEYSVGAACDPGEYTHGNIQEFTTLAKDEIAFAGCGIKPDPNDLANKTPLPELFPNDVVTAGDFPIVVLKSTGSNGTFSGEGYVTLPFLEKFKELIDAADALGGDKVNIGKYSRIRITFNNIGINTDFKLISGEIIASYDPNWGSMVDGDKLVEDIKKIIASIKEFLDNYKGTAEDKAKAIELHKQQDNLSTLLLANSEIPQELKNQITEAKNNAKDSWKALENGNPCSGNTEKMDTGKGGPNNIFHEIEDNFDCYKKSIEDEAKIIEEASNNSNVSACSIPEPERGCAATGNIENPMNDGDWEATIKILKELKDAIANKKAYTYTKVMTNLSAQISIDKTCFDPLMLDYSAMTDKTKTVNEVRFTNEITKSNFSGDYWTLIFNNLLWIKIPKVVENGKDISKDKIDLLEKWLKCGDKPKEEIQTKPATINITAELLSQIFTDTDKSRLEEVSKLINKYSDKFEINTPKRMSHFLGQIGAETGLTNLLEDSYSQNGLLTNDKPRTLRRKNGKYVLKYCALFEGYESENTNDCPFPYCNNSIEVPEKQIYLNGIARYATKQFMQEKKINPKSKYYVGNPNNIAFFDYVYACQLGNGSIDSNDGSRFRGRGFIQLTGYDNYKKFQEKWNRVYGTDNPKDFLCRSKTCDKNLNDLVDNSEMSILSALAYWKDSNSNESATDVNDNSIDDITLKINGGLHGRDKRRLITKKAYKSLNKKK